MPSCSTLRDSLHGQQTHRGWPSDLLGKARYVLHSARGRTSNWRENKHTEGEDGHEDKDDRFEDKERRQVNDELNENEGKGEDKRDRNEIEDNRGTEDKDGTRDE